MEQAAGARSLFEESLAPVDEEADGFVPEVRDEEVSPAVAVDVLGVDSHPRAGHAVRAVACTRGFRDVMKPAAALVEEDEVGTHIVGDVEIDPAVVVQVGGDHPQAAAIGAADARRFGHVGECPVPVVAVEDVPGGLDGPRRAVDSHSRRRVLHEGRRRGIAVTIVVGELPGTVIGHVEVEVAVVVVVEERPPEDQPGRSIPATG